MGKNRNLCNIEFSSWSFKVLVKYNFSLPPIYYYCKWGIFFYYFEIFGVFKKYVGLQCCMNMISLVWVLYGCIETYLSAYHLYIFYSCVILCNEFENLPPFSCSGIFTLRTMFFEGLIKFTLSGQFSSTFQMNFHSIEKCIPL